MFWEPRPPWSLWHFFHGVNRSCPGTTSTANELPYRAVVQLHGPQCKPPLNRPICNYCSEMGGADIWLAICQSGSTCRCACMKWWSICRKLQFASGMTLWLLHSFFLTLSLFLFLSPWPICAAAICGVLKSVEGWAGCHLCNSAIHIQAMPCGCRRYALLSVYVNLWMCGRGASCVGSEMDGFADIWVGFVGQAFLSSSTSCKLAATDLLLVGSKFHFM